MLKKSVLIVDDHPVVVDGIKLVLDGSPEFQVVGDAPDGYQALEKARSLRPDIAIIDIDMPNLNGVDATRQIKALFPEMQIVVYTGQLEKDSAMRLFQAGASALVLKMAGIDELEEALDAVSGGDRFMSPLAGDSLALTFDEKGVKNRLDELTTREMEVFRLLVEMNTPKDISRTLEVSAKTVESHKYSIMRKLGANDIGELIRIAISEKVLDIS